MKGNQIKFYADTPGGDKNKLFTYTANSIDQAMDIAAKFVQEQNFCVRAAYYVNQHNISCRIDKLFDLNKHKNSLIEKQDLKNKLKIIRSHYGLRKENLSV